MQYIKLWKVALNFCGSEKHHRTARYEHWLKLRDAALHNANGTVPESLKEDIPPPPPVDDLDIENLSMDLSQVAIDAEIGSELDDTGIERVPMADPAIDVSWSLIIMVNVILMK